MPSNRAQYSSNIAAKADVVLELPETNNASHDPVRSNSERVTKLNALITKVSPLPLELLFKPALQKMRCFY